MQQQSWYHTGRNPSLTHSRRRSSRGARCSTLLSLYPSREVVMKSPMRTQSELTFLAGLLTLGASFSPNKLSRCLPRRSVPVVGSTMCARFFLPAPCLSSSRLPSSTASAAFDLSRNTTRTPTHPRPHCHTHSRTQGLRQTCEDRKNTLAPLLWLHWSAGVARTQHSLLQLYGAFRSIRTAWSRVGVGKPLC